MTDKLNKCSLPREGELSKKTEQGLETPILKPLIKLAFHEG